MRGLELSLFRMTHMLLDGECYFW